MMQLNNTEIFLFIDGVWKKLEISENIPFPLTLNIADIRDITKRNTTFSKTLVIPGTSNNNDLLAYIFDIANLSTFNVNRKVKCTIVVDTIPVVQEAVFQLTNIKSDDNNHWVYECVVFGDTDNIVKEISDKLLTDLSDISELGHTYSQSNIVNSWGNNWTNGYYYGIADYGFGWDITNIGPTSVTGTKVDQMKPQVYARYLWEKMFQDAGWSYNSNFILNSDVFNNLVILPGNELLLSPTYSYFNSFRAAPTMSTVYTLGHTFSKTALSISNPLQYGYTGSNTTVINGGSTTQSTYSIQGLNDYSSYSSFTSSRLAMPDDTTSPNGDPSNLWSTTVYEYTQPSDGGGIVSLCGTFDITIPNDNDLFASNSLGASGSYPSWIIWDVMVYRSELYTTLGGNRVYMPVNGNNGFSSTNGWAIGSVYGNSASNIDLSLFGATWENIPGGSSVSKQFSTPLFNAPGAISFTNPYAKLLPNEKVWYKLITRVYKNSTLGTTVIGPSFSYTLNTTSNVYNYVDSTLCENLPIDPTSMLPKQFKQIDFFTSIIKMFNFYIEPDKFISKRLNIEPRDDFYSSGSEVDWTDKVDTSQEVNQQVVADTQAKEIILTYKLDKDAYNTHYNDNIKETYGQHKYEVDNDFIKGEKKVEVSFASTPINYLQGPNGLSDDSMLLPVIAKNDNGTLKKTDFIPRILLRSTEGVIGFSDPANYWNFNGTIYPYYPYIGHLFCSTNPREATDDINFGQLKKVFYNLNSLTSNNLFTNHYEKQLDELTDRDSRLVTLSMKLTPQDINDFSFRDRIIIEGISSGTINYFRVNKIDYDPTSKGTFKVELLKAKDIPRRETRPRFILSPIAIEESKVQGPIFGNVNNNITYSFNVGIIGVQNFVGGNTKNVIINGDSNYVGENTKSVFITGDDNYVAAGIEKTFIFGDGVTNSNSNEFIIGASVSTIINGPVTFNGTFSLAGFTLSNVWIDTGGGQIKINPTYASYDVIPANSYATNLGFVGNYWNDLYMGSQIYATGSYLDFYQSNVPIFGINTNGIYTYTGKTITSDNGGGQLALDYASTPNTILLSTDDAALAESYLYLDPNTIVLNSVVDMSLSTAGSINLYLSSNYAYLGTASVIPAIQLLDNGIYMANWTNSSFNAGVTNSVLIGLQGVAVTASNTLYVPNVRAYGDVYIQSGESIINASNDNMQIKFNANSLNDLFLESKSSATNYANLTLTSITSSNIHEAVLLAESSTTTVISAVGADADASTAYIATVLSGVTQYVLSHASNGIIFQGDKVLRHRRATNTEIGYDIQLATTTTTNGATVSLFSGYNIGSYDSIVCEATVLGYDSSNNNTIASKLFASFRNVAGVWTLVSTLDKSQKSSFTTADTELTTDGNTINVEVNGEAATTIEWQCNIKSSYWVT